mgnify:CR=1 FL=1
MPALLLQQLQSEQLLRRSRVLELNTGVVAEFHPRALSPQAERSMHAEPYRLPGTAKHAGVALTGLGTHAESRNSQKHPKSMFSYKLWFC